MGSVEKHGKGILNEGAFSLTETFALAVAMLCVSFSDFICILPCLVTIYTCFEL